MFCVLIVLVPLQNLQVVGMEVYVIPRACSLFPVNHCIPVFSGSRSFLSISKAKVSWFCLLWHLESNKEKCNEVAALWRVIHIRVQDTQKTAREFVGSFYLPGGQEGGRVEGISHWVKSLSSCLPASICLLKKKKISELIMWQSKMDQKILVHKSKIATS